MHGIAEEIHYCSKVDGLCSRDVVCEQGFILR
jgi:hypothetical protein